VLFAVVVQVSGYEAHKCVHSYFVTISSPSTSHVTTTKKIKGKSLMTSSNFSNSPIVSDDFVAGQNKVSEAPMKSPNPSFVYEDLVCNMKKRNFGKKIELHMR
jgi:hypothetical protein